MWLFIGIIGLMGLQANHIGTADVGKSARCAGEDDNLALLSCRSNCGAQGFQALRICKT